MLPSEILSAIELQLAAFEKKDYKVPLLENFLLNRKHFLQKTLLPAR